jgi:aquaporin TIP
MAEKVTMRGEPVSLPAPVRYQGAVATGEPMAAVSYIPTAGATARVHRPGVDPRALLAEFIGIFTLVFAGVGTIAVTSHMGALPSLVAVALAHGLALAVMVSATAAISGGHLNPAVTIGALVGGRICLEQAIGHWVAQVLGAIAAAALIAVCVPATLLAGSGFGIPAPGAGIGIAAAFLTELVLTFFLVFVVYGTAIDPRAPRVGGLFIGLTLTMGILVGGPISGAALNPARFLGPAIVNASQLQYTWLYVIAGLLGGILAGLVWRYAFRPTTSAAAQAA